MVYKKEAGDYLQYVRQFPGGAYAHWTKFPVRVHLPQGSPDSWQKTMEGVVGKWSQHVPLKVVSASEPADVEVFWVNHLVPRLLGVTRLQISNTQMQVTIYLLRPTFYLPEIPERALQGAFSHELGHAVGLFGHSELGSDAMSAAEITPGLKGKPAQIKFSPISARDVNTLKKIYESPPLPEGFSMPQPQEWGWKF